LLDASLARHLPGRGVLIDAGGTGCRERPAPIRSRDAARYVSRRINRSSGNRASISRGLVHRWQPAIEMHNNSHYLY
jgi:hypothetical protein